MQDGEELQKRLKERQVTGKVTFSKISTGWEMGRILPGEQLYATSTG